jgi:hypothetical protein
MGDTPGPPRKVPELEPGSIALGSWRGDWTTNSYREIYQFKGLQSADSPGLSASHRSLRWALD